MYAVEFEAIIENGNIQVPDEIKERFRDRVRVILLASEDKVQPNDFIDRLVDNPVHLANFHPFQRDEIYARYAE